MKALGSDGFPAGAARITPEKYCAAALAGAAHNLARISNGKITQSAVLEKLFRSKWKEMPSGSIDPKILASEPVATIHVDQRAKPEVYLQECEKINWAGLKGNKVRVTFRDEVVARLSRVLGGNNSEKIDADQIVIGAEHLSEEQREGVTKVLAHSHEPDYFQEHQTFNENAVWVIKTSQGRSIETEVINSKGTSNNNHSMDPKLVVEILNAELRKFSDDEYPTEVSFIHSHPGKGTPLSANSTVGGDLAVFKVIVDAFEKQQPKKVKISFIAAPVDDAGNVMFAFEHQTHTP